MKFNYQARTKTGEIQTGTVEASSRQAALSLLKKYELYVTALEEYTVPFYAKKIEIFSKVTKRDLVIFSQQLAVMFKSEVPLLESLQTLAKQIKKRTFREKILNIAKEVEGGAVLSRALGLYPEVFSSFYISMVRSGEVSGKLSEVFSYLAEHLEREYNFSAKLKGAMIYPLVILFIFFVITMIMAIFVVPKLTEFLQETEGELPFITEIIIGFANFLRSQGWLLIIIFIFLLFFLYRFSKTKMGKNFFDRNLLKVPLLGRFLKKIYLSRFALNLSTLISAGLPIARALEVTGEIVDNVVYKKIVLRVRDEVKKGESISSVLKYYPKEISPFLIQMIVVGEKTGHLDSTLMNVVDFYLRDIDRALDNFVKLIEPALIICLGVIVGIFAVGILLPIYQRIISF